MKSAIRTLLVATILLTTAASTSIADDSDTDEEGPQALFWPSEEYGRDRAFVFLDVNSTTVNYLGEICIVDNNPIREMNLLHVHAYIKLDGVPPASTTLEKFGASYSANSTGDFSLVLSGCYGENSLLYQGILNLTAPLIYGPHASLRSSWYSVSYVEIRVQFTDDAGNPNIGTASIDYPRMMTVRIMDGDGDGCLDEEDWEPTNSNECRDTDGDGIGNNADADDDNDGWTDEDESQCHGNSFQPLDDYRYNASSTPADFDGDRVCDFFDYDDDNDGWDDDIEITCGSNPYNGLDIPIDTDGDWVCENVQGNDVCIGDDDRIDLDSDGIPDCVDDIIDSDGDGVSDSNDQFPTNSSEWSDWDSDGIGDNLDEDDDNDGWPDSMDSRPLDDSIQSDTDVYISYAKWAVLVLVVSAAGLSIIRGKSRD